jgi:hypothetical protein
VNRGSEATPLLLGAARRLERLDVALARETYLDAVLAAMFAGGMAVGGGVQEAAEAARAAPPSARPPRAADLLPDGLTAGFADGYAAGVPLLREALRAFRSPRPVRRGGAPVVVARLHRGHAHRDMWASQPR